MQMKEFVTYVLKELSEIQNQNEYLDQKNYLDIYHLVYLESQRSIHELMYLLAEYTHSSLEVTEENVGPFFNFLRKRWERIQNTDAIYSHRYYTHANQICIKLANYFATVTSFKPYELLMPSLTKREYDYDEKLNTVILSDDNKTLIDVFQCLQEAHTKKNTQLKHTHPVCNKECLSELERDRVIKHSSFATHYWDAISRKKASFREFKNRKKALVNQIGRYAPLSSYGKEGGDRLMAALYVPIANLEHLVSELQKYPCTVWDKYISNINLDELRDVLLNEKKFDQAYIDQSKYRDEENYNRAILFLFFLLYRRELYARKDEYTSVSGLLFGKSKTEALIASEIPYTYLQQGNSLKQFPEYLDSFYGDPVYKALTGGRLGGLVEHTMLICNPDYYHKRKQHGWLEIGLSALRL